MKPGLRGNLRLLRLSLERARFELWVLRSKAEARRRGTRLIVDAPHGARFQTMPAFHATPRGLSAPVRFGRRPLISMRIGKNVDLGRGTIIEFRADGHNVLELADHVCFSNGVRVSLFDGRLSLGSGSSIRGNALLKSSGDLEVGQRANVGYNAVLHCSEHLVLEDLVVLAERVSVLDSDHLADGSDVYTQDQPLAREFTRLGRNSLVGANAVILRGVVLGRNAVVAAGAVVRGGEYPAGGMLGGVPAELIKMLPSAPQQQEQSNGL